jgi:tRNA(Ile)-lysidine synthase
MVPPAAAPLPENAASIADDDRPIPAAEFASLLEALGPFEHRPQVAVGVSGGADSMALALLCDSWARTRDGKVTALIVDHGLRADSAAEAATVARWLAARGIDHAILRWEEAKPASAIQQEAREARHKLLHAWCREAGVLHLLLAHHRDDQLETMVLRRERKSGPDGLAAMSAVVERAGLRVLRPLLGVASARLQTTLRAHGQDWVEDPSNRNLAFARVRVRAALARRAEAEDLDSAVQRFGAARLKTETDVANLLARSVTVYPEGWAVIRPEPWQQSSLAIAQRALARVAQTIGGGVYAPRGERLGALFEAMLHGTLEGGRTLGGCRFFPQRSNILVAREAARAVERIALDRAGSIMWDGRFALTVAGSFTKAANCFLARLGEEGWRQVAAAAPESRAIPLPPAVRVSLPSVFDLEGVRAVPHLMYGRRGADPDSVTIVSAMFRPRHALAGPGFAVI